MATNPGMKDLEVQEKKEVNQQVHTREGLYFEPPVDISENSHGMTLLADIPGANAEGLEIDVRDNVLTVSAQVKQPDPKWRLVYQEYRIGSYSRQFRIGHEIDQSKIVARMKDGVLNLKLPKVEGSLPRKITVET